MGGLATEIDDDSADIVIEGAHFSDTGIAKMARRHRLHSEASYRFERGTDRELPPRATARAAALLASLGGATIVPGRHARAGAGRAGDDRAWPPTTRTGWPGSSTASTPLSRRLQEVGCEVRSTPAGQVPTIAPWRAASSRGHDLSPTAVCHARSGQSTTGTAAMVLLVTPPSWRPDLTDPADLAEEVIRLEGYSNVPVRQPRATAGRGPDRAAEGAARDRPHARRRRLRRGALRPVRPGDRGRQPDARAARTRAAPRSWSPTR